MPRDMFKIQDGVAILQKLNYRFFVLVLCPGGSSPGDDYFILLSESFFSKFFSL